MGSLTVTPIDWMPVPTKTTVERAADIESFYEQYVRHHVPYHRNPTGAKGAILRWLPYCSWREWRFWRRHVPRCEVLLDLGCARGREIFTERARLCIGIDIAPSALCDCATHYRLAVRSKLNLLPLADESVDCATTSHVLGHIPQAEKDAVLSEMTRVLRPRGKSLHLIETDGDHPLVRYAKGYPDLYHSFFIEPDGHVGLERPSAALSRLERHGLRILHCDKVDAGPFHPRVLLKHFDNELAEQSKRMARRVRLSRWIMGRPTLLALTEIFLGVHHYTLGQWAYSLDRAQFLAVVAEKR